MLGVMLQQHGGPDLVSVSEAELAIEDEFKQEGYVVVPALAGSKTNKIRQLMLIKKDLKYSVMKDNMSHAAQTVWVNLPDYDIIVGAAYRQFGANTAVEVQELNTIADQVRTAVATSEVCLMGDFNLNLALSEKPEYKYAKMLRDWTQCYKELGLHWLETGPTWSSHGIHRGIRQSSTIDHVYASANLASVSRISVGADSASDHFPLLLHIGRESRTCTAKNKKGQDNKVWKRNFNRINYDALCDELIRDGFDKFPAPVGTTVDKYLKDLYESITPYVDRHAPLKLVPVAQSRAPLCISKQTKETMRARDEAKKKAGKADPNYKRLRNKAVSLLKKDKMCSAVNTINKAGDPARKAAAGWRLANSHLNPRESGLPRLQGTDSDLESACACNEFYINKVEKIAAAFTGGTGSSESKIVDDTGPKFKFHSIGVKKTKELLRRMNGTQSIGVDGLPATFWKKLAPALAVPLMHMVNASFRESRVPDLFKIAKITPIYKGGAKKKDDPASYRPVAVLPAASKVLELAVLEQLGELLEETGCLPQVQHGFRPGHSTSTAIASAVARWDSLLRDPGTAKRVYCAAYDFSSAFDTVAPDKLLAKLDSLGMDMEAKDWFKSYLTGGKQAVIWNGKISGYLDIKRGVRQGSILGPILFILLTSTIPDALGDCSLYADDVFAWKMSLADLEAATEALQSKAEDLNLKLNAGKTQYCALAKSYQTARSSENKMSAASAEVERADCMDLLGWAVGADMTCSPFYRKQLASLRSRLYAMRRLSASVPPMVLGPVARAIFNGKASYNVENSFLVRLDATDPLPEPMEDQQVVHNDLSRLLLKKRRADGLSTRTLSDRTGIPTVNQMVFRASALGVWKALRSTKFSPLTKLFDRYRMTGSSRLAAKGDLLNPVPETKAYFMSNAIRIWNRFPALREADTLHKAQSLVQKLLRTLPEGRARSE